MFIAGYQVVDFRDCNIKTGARADNNIRGIYATIESAGYKPLLLANLVIDGVKYGARYIALDLHKDRYYGILVLGLTRYKITVSNTDKITIVKEGD